MKTTDCYGATMRELEETRQSLVIRLKEHNNCAWEEFVSVYEQSVYWFCRRKGLQHADASDVTQEVLLTVHRSIDDWQLDRSKGSFRGWLFTVAHNETVDKFTRMSKEARATGDGSVDAIAASIPQSDGASVFALEFRRTLFCWAAERVQAEVHTHTWRAFWLTAVEGRSASDVADELNISVGSVYTSKCRVLARLRETIESIENIDNCEASHVE